MHLSEIQEGKLLTMVLENESEYKVEFRGIVTPINFSIFSPQLAEDIKVCKGSMVNVKFFDRDINYTFTCKIAGLRQGQNNIISCNATSVLKETPRRADIRINIRLKVKIYAYENAPDGFRAGQFICEAVSDDVSKNGARIFSDHNLDAPIGSLFVLELSVPRMADYLLPAKMVRSQDNAFVRVYNYDYGFVFLDSQDMQEKLILDVMQASISGILI